MLDTILSVPDRSLSVMDRSRQSLTLCAIADIVDRLATSPREVVAALLRLEVHEVDIAIRYMSPANFARALHVRARELIRFFRPDSDERALDKDPLWCFVRWFHVKRSLAAASIQRRFRRRLHAASRARLRPMTTLSLAQLLVFAELKRRQDQLLFAQAMEICVSRGGGHRRLHER